MRYLFLITKRKIQVFLVLLCVLSLTGCFQEVHNRKNVICLIDYSGTIKPETLEIYGRTIVDNVVMNLGEFDKMVLMPIDEGSKIQAVQLIIHDMSKEEFRKPNDNPIKANDIAKDRLATTKNGFRDADLATVKLQKEIRKQYTNFTDLLGSLEQAASRLEKNEPVSYYKQFSDWNSGEKEFVNENTIIILSDMIHDSTDLSFVQTKLDEKMIAKIIADLKAKGRIPNLTGTKVFVCGRTGKNNAVIEGIQAFWKKYFEEAHADLSVYDYDSSKTIADYMQTQN